MSTPFASLVAELGHDVTLSRGVETPVTVTAVRGNDTTEQEIGSVFSSTYAYTMSVDGFPASGITRPEVNDTLTDGSATYRVQSVDPKYWKTALVGYRVRVQE